MSLNDPQWGRKGGGNGGGGEGPPDLEEMWRNLNRRLGGMFGRKGPSNAGTPPAGPRQMGGFGLLAALLILVWLASGVYTVDESQRALVLTFGKHTSTSGPGLNMRWPWPIQSHEYVNFSQSRNLKIGDRAKGKSARERESLTLTRDKNIVDVEFGVIYTLKNAQEFQFNLAQQDAVVQQVAESVMREIIGRSTMDGVLNADRAKIAADAQALMQVILDRYKSGIMVTDVQLLSAHPPEQVQDAFNDVNKADQDRERSKSEGQTYYNDVVTKADGTARVMVQQAEAYRSAVVSNAEGEAARFRHIVAEYAKAPVVTRERLYLDAMQQVLASTTKIMVDARSGGNMLFLPLDKIIQMSSGSLPEVPAMSSKPALPDGSASNPMTDPSRSRDSLRSRERETR